MKMKMKICIITLLLVATCKCINTDANTEDIQYFYKRLQNVIKSRCSANAGETETDKALEALDIFRSEWQITLPREKLFGVAFYNYCVNNAQNFTTYLLTFIDSLVPCLSSEEEYLKPFIINGYGDYNQHLCKFMELLTVSESKRRYDNKCSKLLQSNYELDPDYTCYKDSTIFGDNATVTVITKQKFCEDIQDIRCCYDKIFKENCLEIPEYGDMKRVLLAQSLTQCVDELASSEEENSSEKSME